MTDKNTRRKFLKSAGAAGALGALAGCAGSGGGTPTPQVKTVVKERVETRVVEEEGETVIKTKVVEKTPEGGGKQEPVTLTLWSSARTHNPKARQFYPLGLDHFEQMFPGVTIDLTTFAPGTMTEKINAAVNQGGPPFLAGASSTFWRQGELFDMKSYWDETPELEKNFPAAIIQGAEYRGAFMGGPSAATPIQGGLVTKWFKQVGVEPEDLETWTGFRRAIEKVDEQTDVKWAFEETGTQYDLETYWGAARTAYTDGTDPWLDVEDQGTHSDPHIRINENPRTDGMIFNTLDMAAEYSSEEAASRSDEEMPNLFFTDRAASFLYGVGGFQRYRTVKDDATFGWDGDVYEFPDPKLDPNYGDEFDIPELAGKEGEHGGHVWSGAMGYFKKGAPDNQQRALDMGWKFNLYQDTNIVTDWFIKRWNGYNYPRAVPYAPAYEPTREYMKQQLGNVPQVWAVANENMRNWPKQYAGTGRPWDVGGVDQIRWTDINLTISETMAGQHGRDETPELIANKVRTTLREQNQ